LEEAAKKANTEAGFQNATVTDLQRQKINELADAMQAGRAAPEPIACAACPVAVDTRNFVKNFDQAAITSLNNFGSALTDIATGTVTAAEGFRNLGIQVIKAITDMLIKMTSSQAPASLAFLELCRTGGGTRDQRLSRGGHEKPTHQARKAAASHKKPPPF
jgi:hypothetical protein